MPSSIKASWRRDRESGSNFHCPQVVALIEVFGRLLNQSITWSGSMPVALPCMPNLWSSRMFPATASATPHFGNLQPCTNERTRLLGTVLKRVRCRGSAKSIPEHVIAFRTISLPRLLLVRYSILEVSISANSLLQEVWSWDNMVNKC